jgi:hypothetical protein
LDDIFERRDGETAQAYEAARVYFDMRAERSIMAVTQKLAKSRTLISRWSRNWNWVERARAYDKYFDLEVKNAITSAARMVALEWEGRERAMRQRKYDTHLRGLDKFDKMLAFPLATVTTETVEGPDGQIILQTTITPARWTFDTLAPLARTMFALGREAICNEGGIDQSEVEREEDWMIEDFKPRRDLDS